MQVDERLRETGFYETVAGMKWMQMRHHLPHKDQRCVGCRHFQDDGAMILPAMIQNHPSWDPNAEVAEPGNPIGHICKNFGVEVQHDTHEKTLSDVNMMSRYIGWTMANTKICQAPTGIVVLASHKAKGYGKILRDHATKKRVQRTAYDSQTGQIVHASAADPMIRALAPDAIKANYGSALDECGNQRKTLHKDHGKLWITPTDASRRQMVLAADRIQKGKGVPLAHHAMPEQEFGPNNMLWIHDASGQINLGTGAYTVIGNKHDPPSCTVLYFCHKWSEEDLSRMTLGEDGKIPSGQAEALGAALLSRATWKNQSVVPTHCKQLLLACDASAWINTVRDTKTDDRLMAQCRMESYANLKKLQLPVFFRRRPRKFAEGADILSRLDVEKFTSSLTEWGFRNISRIY